MYTLRSNLNYPKSQKIYPNFSDIPQVCLYLTPPLPDAHLPILVTLSIAKNDILKLLHDAGGATVHQ